MRFAQLSKEWERVETLADFARQARQQAPLSDERLTDLQDLQNLVLQARRDGAWQDLDVGEMNTLEFDVLACTLAPDMSPRIAWMYQALSGRKEDPYPTLHFLQELLSLEPADTPALYQAVNENAPLRQKRLIRTGGEGPYTTLRPGPGVSARLRGTQAVIEAPAGTSLVKQRATWDDLALPDSLMERLREFLSYLTTRDQIEQDWGGVHNSGPVALFSGPSGTGKTFSASVLATELGWPLFRVDLGRLVSKYIGECQHKAGGKRGYRLQILGPRPVM